MCNFFSFVTDPVNHPAEHYYFDWEYRKGNLDDDGVDSHSHICSHFNLNEDFCNKYEFNPLTKRFVVDQINAERDDSRAAEKWVNRIDFKTIVEPLIIKPIVNPLKLPKVSEPTEEQIGWLKEWTSVLDSVWTSVRYAVLDSVWTSVRYSVGNSVWDSVGNSVGDSVRTSVRYSVGNSVGNSVWDSVEASFTSVGDSVRNSVWNSVGNSVGESVGESVWGSVRNSVWNSVWDSVGESVWGSAWAYFSTFFDIEYKFDFSPAVKLWESGLVPSFDGTTWRLHSGENADSVFEWTPPEPPEVNNE